LAIEILFSIRALINKRKELEELRENSKVLRAQLRSKKKGIQTLEALLKESALDRNRDRESRHRNKSRNYESPTPVVVSPTQPEIPKAKPPFTKFFVAGPNGLCVEFNVKNTAIIYDLKQDVKKAFISKRGGVDLDNQGRVGEPTVSLIYQGRVLLDDSTIDNNEIRAGDTVVAVVEMNKINTEPRPVEEKKAPDPQPLSSREMIELLSKHHEVTSTELRFDMESHRTPF
jgi:hypothetical protein